MKKFFLYSCYLGILLHNQTVFCSCEEFDRLSRARRLSNSSSSSHGNPLNPFKQSGENELSENKNSDGPLGVSGRTYLLSLDFNNSENSQNINENCFIGCLKKLNDCLEELGVFLDCR